jgi:hypothetical protein
LIIGQARNKHAQNAPQKMTTYSFSRRQAPGFVGGNACGPSRNQHTEIEGEEMLLLQKKSKATQQPRTQLVWKHVTNIAKCTGFLILSLNTLYPINKEEQERKESNDSSDIQSFVILLETPGQLYTAPCPRWFALLYMSYWNGSGFPKI